MTDLIRGHVYLVDPWGDIAAKPLLVVSDNRRNRSFGDALAVRLTTTPRPKLPSIVELSASEAPMVGRVLRDSFIVIFPDEVLQARGALSPPTRRNVQAGLRHSLSIL